MCDTKGVIYEGRTEHMNVYKARYAAKTRPARWPKRWWARTCFSPFERRRGDAGYGDDDGAQPDHLRPRQPDPEIAYDVALAARPDAIVATGRSDFPTRSTTSSLPLHFPRRPGRARHHHQRRDEARRHARPGLAGETGTCPIRCYAPIAWSDGIRREYIIPTPFDPRVLIWEASAVAQAAMETGVARRRSISASIARNWSAAWPR